MDRVIVYPAAAPLDTDMLSTNLNAMIALGFALQAVFGKSTVVDGLTLLAQGSPNMTVTVNPGSIIVSTVVDQNAYGSLGSDPLDALVKIGVNLTPTAFTLTAPTTSGYSQIYLLEAQFDEFDTGATVLPYYNATDPALPYQGPTNSGAAQNTLRVQHVALQVKAGTPAPTGTQTAPSADSGWVGLFAITVVNGQTAIVQAECNASYLVTAPFINQKLGATNQGFGGALALTGSGDFTVPMGVTRLRYRVKGGGGGGGGGGASGQGNGGGGGGASKGYMTGLTPGQVIAYSQGTGGAAGAAGGGSGGNGTASTFGTITANGGTGGSGNGTGSIGAGGTATGGEFNYSGGPGSFGYSFTGGPGDVGGKGGATGFGESTGDRSIASGASGLVPGEGGGGGANSAGGGAGAAGEIEIEY
jgi:hypothetical protein